MKYLSWQTLYVLVMMICMYKTCSAKAAQEFHQSYKKINEELINIRKEFSATQPKVYFLLDQIEKIKKIMQETLIKKSNFKKKCHDFAIQTDILKNKNLLLKQKVFDLQSELEKFAQHLAQEQSINTALKAESAATQASDFTKATTDRQLKTTLQPLSTQVPQSLSLTSTSEPISPR